MHALMFSILIASGIYAGESAVTVKPIGMTESRSVNFEKPSGDSFMMQQGNRLEVELLLSGKAVERAARWGDVKLATAVDDRGSALEMQSISFQDEKFEDLDREQMWFFEDEPPADRIKVKLPFAAPDRAASSISLKGSLVLVDVVTEDHMVELAANVGKIVLADVVKELGATIKLNSFDEAMGAEIEVKDPNGAIADLAIVDADGKDISSTTGWSGWNNMRTYHLSAMENYPASAQLRVSVIVKSTNIEVPFELKDMRLP